MSTLPEFSAMGVSLQYDEALIVDDVSFKAHGGQLVGLIGPNGAGKTTLIKAMAGLLKPSKGAMALDGCDLTVWSKPALAQRVGYLSQTRAVHWPVTVARLVSLGRIPHRGPWDSLSEDDQMAIDAALTLTDSTEIKDRTITTLSGGELARVLLARVLAGEPQVILADEPVSGLDPGHRLQVLGGLKALAQSGRLVVVVLHDLTLASRFCDRLILMNHGRVAADGAPKDVLTPARLSSVYGITSLQVTDGDEAAVLPWATVTSAKTISDD
ncbi:MAG: ABC transporter ATP-binding protein [Rhodospirillaceae bacterium]